MRWKGCIILNYYSVGDSQPYMLAVRLLAFHVWRLLSLSTSRPKIVGCRRMTVVPCLGSQHSKAILSLFVGLDACSAYSRVYLIIAAVITI